MRCKFVEKAFPISESKYLCRIQCTKMIGINNSNIVHQGLNPAFLLYLSGPYLGIGRAVLGKDFTMEPLTPIFPLLFMKNDPNAMEALARVLVALKTGLHELNDYYQVRYRQ